MPRIYTRVPIEERFWAHVEKSDGCWLWTGCKQKAGYGRIASGDPSKPTVEGAHRIAYELQCGPIPEGLSVLHHCDRPACCRGDHLFVGTAKDNNADMHAKGRYVPFTPRRGSDAGNAVLSERDVHEILASTETYQKLAKRFGTAPATIKAVRDGITWKHIGPERKPFGGRRTGEDHRRSKLTETDVIAIRESTAPTSELARKYKVDPVTLSHARWGGTWRHLPPSKYDQSLIIQIGEKHHNARLTADAVRDIRTSPAENNDLAVKYGVSVSNIAAVRKYLTWRHVT